MFSFIEWYVIGDFTSSLHVKFMIAWMVLLTELSGSLQSSILFEVNSY